MRTLPILCGSISGSIGGLGVRMHNAAYKALDMPYTYVSFRPMELEGAIKAMRTLGIRGLGVTMPYKVLVMPYLDTWSEAARQIGAVNTVVNEDGYLTGHNTDWYGVDKALSEVTSLADKEVVVMGAGGAAKAAVFAALKHTKDVRLYNRSEERGRKLAETFGCPYMGSPENIGRDGQGYDILINATAVGFKNEEATLLEATQLLEGKVVLDMVFTPVITKLLKDAEKRGCQIIEGYKVSLHQACYQFELYTNEKAPAEVMLEALKAGR